MNKTCLEPLFDVHGYPHEKFLDAIASYDAITLDDRRDILNSVCASWNNSYGNVDITQDIYKFVTGGWSGNELLISAMAENILFNAHCWVASVRGGEYWYSLRNDVNITCVMK